MAVQIQLRGGTLAEWTLADPIIADREMVLETDTDQFKIGNGVDNYLDLPYGGLVGEQGLTGSTGATGAAGATGPGVATGGTTGQFLAKVDGTDYNTTWTSSAPTAGYTSVVKHEVKLGEAIAKGQAVYVSTANGTNMIVSKASNASEATSSKTMGILESGGSTNATVNVITEGIVSGLNTSGATAGDPVWLGTAGNLIYGLASKPYAPAHLVFIGVVTLVNSSNGEIFVRPQNGFELKEIHDVSILTAATNDFIKLDASGLWVNSNIIDGGTA